MILVSLEAFEGNPKRLILSENFYSHTSSRTENELQYQEQSQTKELLHLAGYASRHTKGMVRTTAYLSRGTSHQFVTVVLIHL